MNKVTWSVLNSFCGPAHVSVDVEVGNVAESGRNCKECGLPLKVFSGLTINGDRYHDFCAEKLRAAPKASTVASSGVARSWPTPVSSSQTSGARSAMIPYRVSVCLPRRLQT